MKEFDHALTERINGFPLKDMSLLSGERRISVSKMSDVTDEGFMQGLDACSLERARQRLIDLYQPSFQKRTVWHASKGTYSTLDSSEAARREGRSGSVRFPLNNTTLNRHLKGTSPLAVFPRHESKTSFFAFDVDTKDKAKHHARTLVQTLLDEGIRHHHVHVVFSGSKGYHVTMFFDQPVSTRDAIALGRYVRAKAGLAGEDIEFRPDGRGLKLPLTLHPKTKRFSCYCDPLTMEPMDTSDSHKYLAEIAPMCVEDDLADLLATATGNTSTVDAMEAAGAVRRAEREQRERQAVRVHDERVLHTTEDKRAAVEGALKFGLKHPGTRWNTVRAMVPYLHHEMGYEPDGIRAFLADWTVQQKERGMVDSSLEECEHQHEKLITEWLPKTDGFYAKKRNLNVTIAEFEWVLTVKQRCARDLLWSFLLLSKAYAAPNGIFYCSYERINRMFQPKPLSTNTINRHRQWLADNGYIEMHKPADPREQFRTRKATRYRILFDAPASSDVVDEVSFDKDMNCRDLLFSIAAKLYDDPKQLRKMKLAA